VSDASAWLEGLLFSNPDRLIDQDVQAISEILEERDALLMACEAIHEWLVAREDVAFAGHCETCDVMLQLTAAIAKAVGAAS
jgi:hypothetical protein